MLTVKPPYWKCINHSHPLARGLVGCWAFNEGTGNRVNDLARQDNAGTITGALWTPGEDGWALDFDGSNDHITVPARASLSFPNNVPMSIVMSVKRDGSGSLLDKYDVPDTEYVLGLSSTAIYFWIYDKVEAEYIGRRAPIFGTDKYYHLASVYDGGTTCSAVKIYVDTAQTDNQNFKSVGTFITMRETSQELAIGRANSGLQADFDGKIGSVMMWKRALSAEEIVWLRREPHAMFH